ncbi:MAG: molecular chaperone [Syntrophothermus sp.]
MAKSETQGQITAPVTGAAGKAELAEAARCRGNLYGILSMIFSKEPTAELLERLRDPAFTQALGELGVQFGEDFHNRPDDELLLELAVEYARLFLGPGKHLSPHESVYVGKFSDKEGRGLEGLLCGQATVEVKEAIAEAGFEFLPGYRGLPDHLGVELEFMQLLTGREAEAWQKGDGQTALNCLEQEYHFVNNHLARWIPLFCEKVVESARLDFYRETAKLTRAFVQSEAEDLPALLAEVRGERECLV